MKTEKPTREERLKAYEYARECLSGNLDNQTGICAWVSHFDDTRNFILKDYPELMESKPYNKGYFDYWFSSAKERIQVLTKIINKMKDEKKINLELPSDCEAKFDEENNVLIISKKEEGVYIPDSVEEVKGYDKWLCIIKGSSKERLSSFQSLSKLVEMRDASNGDWRADWEATQTKWCIVFYRDEPELRQSAGYSDPLHFKSEEIAQAFLKKHRELILTAKELL